MLLLSGGPQYFQLAILEGADHGGHLHANVGLKFPLVPVAAVAFDAVGPAIRLALATHPSLEQAYRRRLSDRSLPTFPPWAGLTFHTQSKGGAVVSDYTRLIQRVVISHGPVGRC